MKRVVLVALAALTLCPWSVSAHDVPDDVRIRIFIKPEGDKMIFLVRIPANALIDILFPTLPESSWLDLKRIDGFAREGARVWVADLLSVREGDNLLPAPDVLATRISRVSNSSFDTFQQALDHVRGDPLPSDTLLLQDNATVDALLETPIQSARSAFSFEPRFARVGVRVTTTLRFLPPDGGIRQFEYEGDAEPFALNPSWNQAVRRLLQEGFAHYWTQTDYLLFLLCVALVFERFRLLIPFAAAFAAAQSAALIGSAFSWIPSMQQIPPPIWGVLMAAAISYMGIEAIVAGGAQDRRWWLAIVSGLVFGSGIWYAFKPVIQFGGAHHLASAIAFNTGILLSYVSALALLVIAVKFLMRISSAPRVAIIIAAAIAIRISWHRMLDRGHALSLVPMSVPALSVPALTLVGIVVAVALMVAVYRMRRTSSVA